MEETCIREHERKTIITLCSLLQLTIASLNTNRNDKYLLELQNFEPLIKFLLIREKNKEM